MTYTVTAYISASKTGTLSNTASLTAPAGVVNPNMANNSATDTDKNAFASSSPAATSMPPSTTSSTSSLVEYPVPPHQNNIEASLDCNQSDGYVFAWTTGDLIQLTCAEGSVVRITRVDDTALNPDLPAGYQYVTAFNVEVFQNGSLLPLMPEGGFVQLMLASRQENPSYGIMAWDKDKNDWTLLDVYQEDRYGASVIFPFDPSDLQDEQKILQGTHLVTDENPNRELVRTNFPGLFVLVQQQ